MNNIKRLSITATLLLSIPAIGSPEKKLSSKALLLGKTTGYSLVTLYSAAITGVLLNKNLHTNTMLEGADRLPVTGLYVWTSALWAKKTLAAGKKLFDASTTSRDNTPQTVSNRSKSAALCVGYTSVTAVNSYRWYTILRNKDILAAIIAAPTILLLHHTTTQAYKNFKKTVSPSQAQELINEQS